MVIRGNRSAEITGQFGNRKRQIFIRISAKHSSRSVQRTDAITFIGDVRGKNFMQAVIEHGFITDSEATRTTDLLGTKEGVFARLFGCRHRRLTRPIADGRSSFMSCLECGARKRFDTESFTVSGPFYYPPTAGVRP